MEPWTLVGSLLVGLAAGVLSGLFGVGGAVITTPGIRAFGASPLEAVGSTIPAILPAAITGAHRYHREGLVDTRVALSCGGAGTAFAVLGSKASDLVDARWLMVATAALLFWSGLSSIRKARTAPPPVAAHPLDQEADEAGEPSSAAHAPPTVAALMAVGALAGFVAGLLGIGGGAIMMPLFVNVLRLPVKTAVGSSLVAVAMFAVPAMVTHAWLGHIDWSVAGLLVVGTVPGARLGSRLAIGATDRTMRLALGVFFCLVAVVYGARELGGIVDDDAEPVRGVAAQLR